MAKEKGLYEILRAEMARLRPDQVAVFRAELVKTLPAAIKAAADVALEVKTLPVNQAGGKDH